MNANRPQELKDKLTELKNSQQIVQVRGLNLTLEQIQFEDGPISTRMWNPLHFAVFEEKMDTVKYFLSEIKVGVKITAPKALADKETEPTNSSQVPEDKILLLLLASEKRNTPMLEYLLEELHYFWPSSLVIEHLLSERLNNSVKTFPQTGQVPWLDSIKAVLRSRTAHNFYLNLSFKKR